MALTDNGNEMIMPVQPMYGGMGNGGFGGFGGDWGSLIVLFLIAAMFGGFGNGFGGWGGNNLAADGAMIYPWMNQANITTDGFQNQMLNDNVTSIRDGIHSLSTQLCNCCSDMQMALASGFAGVEQGANARQMANMQTAFDLQNTVNTGFNNIGLQLCQASGENRLANCQTQNTIQNEGNMTRFADANNTRDLLTNQTQNTQAILDKLCQLELDGKNNRIADLERQLTMANFKESQTAQNAFIAQGFSNEVDQLYNRLSNCPVPSTPVYGRTPIFTCDNNNNGCGCGNF